MHHNPIRRGRHTSNVDPMRADRNNCPRADRDSHARGPADNGRIHCGKRSVHCPNAAVLAGNATRRLGFAPAQAWQPLCRIRRSAASCGIIRTSGALHLRYGSQTMHPLIGCAKQAIRWACAPRNMEYTERRYDPVPVSITPYLGVHETGSTSLRSFNRCYLLLPTSGALGS